MKYLGFLTPFPVSLQVPKWEGDNQLCRIYSFPTALFPEWHSSCPAPLQSLLPDTRLHDQSHPRGRQWLWHHWSRCLLFLGPVTSITAPFYDASFSCQVCLQLTEVGGGLHWMKQNLRPKPYLSLSSIRGSVGWGSSMPDENSVWAQKTLSVQVPLLICCLCVGHTVENWNWWSMKAYPHTPAASPRSSRCIPLAVWATETNKKHFRLF